MEIRAEKPEDIETIHQINAQAFRRESEANLVDQLRSTIFTFSFIAVKSDQTVGHIFFSPVAILGECTDNLLLLGLAPVAVHPDHQKQGIGSLLIRYSVAECARLGCKAVFVLGSPEYYPRFGFIPAQQKGLKCEYPVPGEAFMVMELVSGALKGKVGTVKYRTEFDKLV